MIKIKNIKSGNRNKPINPNNQPNHIIRNAFSSSSSSTTIRNVRRTITNSNSNEANTDLRSFNRNTFKELDNLHSNNRLPTAFDNFDSLNANRNHNFNHHHNNPNNPNINPNFNSNLRNLNNDHSELTIETSSRVTRPIQSNPSIRTYAVNNNFSNVNRNPLTSIKPIPNRINGPPTIPGNNELLDNSARIVTVNANVRNVRNQPNMNSNTDNYKLSNATGK